MRAKQRKRAYVGAAVVEAQAFSETHINSFFWEALDGASMGAPGSPWNLGTTVGHALADGLDHLQAIGTRMGAKPKYAARHASYYLEAAQVLGLVEQGRGALTTRTSSSISTCASRYATE